MRRMLEVKRKADIPPQGYFKGFVVSWLSMYAFRFTSSIRRAKAHLLLKTRKPRFYGVLSTNWQFQKFS